MERGHKIWNFRHQDSLRMGLLKSVERELMKYNLDSVGVQMGRLQMLHTKVETSKKEQ